MPRASTTSDPFNAIAEPRRRHILEFIAAEERSVSEIADALELGQPSVSKHLQVLRDVGLVTRQARRPADHVSNERRNASHDSRLVPDVRPALARTTPAHQGTRGGETMTTTAPVSENQTFTITEEIAVRASLEQTFAVARGADGPAQRNPGRHADADDPGDRIPAAAGIATSAATTATCGVSCRASSGRRCWRSGARCSCRRPQPRTCCTG